MTTEETGRGHTDGPWSFTQCPVIEGDWVIRTSDPDPELREVIEVCNADEADVRLIAAAPELLEALRKATLQIAVWRSINGDVVGALVDVEEECRAAIRKATEVSQ